MFIKVLKAFRAGDGFMHQYHEGDMVEVEHIAALQAILLGQAVEVPLFAHEIWIDADMVGKQVQAPVEEEAHSPIEIAPRETVASDGPAQAAASESA